ncbi:radical SAM/SPASM domain-containing protein [Paraclostridium sordellii]|uniref:radical SAM/SPASM domain-containing protein n=1 Tax=Paraclostridium sordellii TaxID=1505 RepID=UPI0005E9292E|nr:radical SAM protein [Paeniclostridium sordellii]CEN23623.1 radical SAM domain-containing protein [[Clostridium] sordellii] [Paeniclostridium sordellii]
MYKFSDYSRTIFNEDKVVLGNRETGQWIRISREVYDILNLGIKNKLTLNQLKSKLYDEEDRGYIEELYKKLASTGMIEVNDDKIKFRNRIASVEVTHRCNLKCTHCCIDAAGVVSDKADLSTEEVKELLDKLIEWSPESIMLSGGEPMLRADFIELLKYLRTKYNGRIILSTNGTFISPKNVDILINNTNQIDISLDGVDEKSCSLVRGPGVFDKVISNIKMLKSKGFNKISVSMVVSDKTEHLEEKFIELNEKLGTSPVVRGFSPVGRGEENIDIFSDIEKDKYYISEEYLSDDYDEAFGICPCSAGKREIMVAYNGDLYPCPSFMDLKFKLGNIFEIDRLTDLTGEGEREQYKLLDRLDPENYEECKDCKVNLFCWTCPGELERIKDNPLVFKDRCKQVKPVLYKRVWGR